MEGSGNPGNHVRSLDHFCPVHVVICDRNSDEEVIIESSQDLLL